MPSNLYRIRTGANGTVSGRELIDTMEALSQAYATTRRIVNAMTQQRDDTTNTDTAYVTPSQIYGFVDANDALSSAVAHAAFLELDSMLQAIGPALEQGTSRFKQ
jgi:hypothetical protein